MVNQLATLVDQGLIDLLWQLCRWRAGFFLAGTVARKYRRRSRLEQFPVHFRYADYAQDA